MNIMKDLKARYCILIMFLTSLMLTLLMFFLAIPSFETFSPITFLMNFFPIISLMFFLFYLSGNFVVSVSIISVTVITMSVVNHYKILYRHYPLVPADFYLFAEVIGIARSLSKVMLSGVILGFAVLILLAVIIFRKVKNEKPRLKYSIIIMSTLLLLNIFLYNGIYTKDYAKNSGLISSFFYALSKEKSPVPKNYNEDSVLALISKYKNYGIKEKSAKPHIFLILGEGYSDIPFSENLQYKSSPVENLNNIKKESINGHIIVPNIGGGTSDTEFDILTGISTRNYRGVPYSNMLVDKPIEAVPQILKNAGYKTKAVHPGDKWFYKRDKVFSLLGFDSFTTIESFNKENSKGLYISEEETFDYVINDFKKYIDKNEHKPLFEFIITIQNHGPYLNKYGEKYPFEFSSAIDFNNQDVNALSNYLEGISDTDREMGRLTKELDLIDEPSYVVFFGDHLPLLSNHVYDGLISERDELRLVRLPYFIWANKAAGKLKEEHLQDISSFYLGVELLKLAGQTNSYFNFLQYTKSDYPVIMEDYNGDKIEQLINWGYYIIK